MVEKIVVSPLRERSGCERGSPTPPGRGGLPKRSSKVDSSVLPPSSLSDLVVDRTLKKPISSLLSLNKHKADQSYPKCFDPHKKRDKNKPKVAP